jgi:hypothetical protein
VDGTSFDREVRGIAREARQNPSLYHVKVLVHLNVNVPGTKNIKMFGDVHVYEHEHVHVLSSKVRSPVSFASLP